MDFPRKSHGEKLVKSENSTIYVNRTVILNGEGRSESGAEDVISVHKFETEPAKVTVDYALTINLGNFESAKIGVSVSVPCYVAEIDKAYEFAQAWAEERLSREREMITDRRNNQGEY